MGPDQHLQMLKSRRSRRQFTGADVPLPAVLAAVEAATHAPSGANGQPWEFLLVPKGPIRDEIERMCRDADERFHTTAPPWLRDFFERQQITVEKIYFEAAPWLVVVFGRRDLPYWLQSVWLAVSNFVNHIHAQGYGTVVWTPTLGRDFNHLVGIEPDWSCQAVLPIGVPDESEVIVPRLRVPVAGKVQVLTSSGPVRLEDYEASGGTA